MIRNAPPKHPGSSKWYWFEWSDRELQGATLNNVTWTLPAGINLDDASVSGQRMGIKVSGGTLDADYELEAEVVTSAGETLHIQVRISIRNSGH